MTFWEKHKAEHPKAQYLLVIKMSCPYKWGYESIDESLEAHKRLGEDCFACWNREVKNGNP